MNTSLNQAVNEQTESFDMTKPTDYQQSEIRDGNSHKGITISTQEESIMSTVSNIMAEIQQDKELTNLIVDLSTVKKQFIHANQPQYMAMGLVSVSTHLIKDITSCPTLIFKVDGISNTELNVVTALFPYHYLPLISDQVQSLTTKKHFQENPNGTLLCMLDPKKQKIIRKMDNNIKHGKKIIVCRNPVPEKYTGENVLGILVLPPVPDGQVLSDATKLTAEQQAKADVIKAQIKFWALKNGAKFSELLKSRHLSKPEDISEEYFNIWYPILTLASLTTTEILQAMYSLMLDNNPLKNQLEPDIALLLDIKAISQKAKSNYPKETGIASAMLLGNLKELHGGKWEELNTKSLSRKMNDKFEVSSEPVTHDFISTTGYKFDAIEQACKTHLDLSKFMQQKRYKETCQTIAYSTTENYAEK